MMENGKKLEFPRRAGGGQGEPGVPSISNADKKLITFL
jgi:hypothetical protein